MARLPTTAGFVRILRDGQSVAIGLGVIEHGWMGLYSLVTAPHARRQGYASTVIGALYDWARNNGATRAYLQVHSTNANALRLYEKLGYRPLYEYWYMQKNPPRAVTT
jgi:GNAT superfamily N-acetyltransferase